LAKNLERGKVAAACVVGSLVLKKMTNEHTPGGNAI
jgi:hypothetical protein